MTDKFKVTSWMMNNLKASTISVYSISLRHAVASTDIEENKKKGKHVFLFENSN